MCIMYCIPGIWVCVFVLRYRECLEVKKGTAAYEMRHWDRDAPYLIHLSLGLLEAPVA